MNKPLLIVIAGRPASGKTTLAHLLAKELKCPLLSRDEFKEGRLNTLRLNHSQLPNGINEEIYETFFQAIEFLISKNISIIIEAAFQHKLWEPKLKDFLSMAEVKIIVCKISTELAIARFENRILNFPERENYHGDDNYRNTSLLTEEYKMVSMNVPTIEVDTTFIYIPGLEKIIDFIRS